MAAVRALHPARPHQAVVEVAAAKRLGVGSRHLTLPRLLRLLLGRGRTVAQVRPLTAIPAQTAQQAVTPHSARSSRAMAVVAAQAANRTRTRAVAVVLGSMALVVMPRQQRRALLVPVQVLRAALTQQAQRKPMRVAQVAVVVQTALLVPTVELMAAVAVQAVVQAVV